MAQDSRTDVVPESRPPEHAPGGATEQELRHASAIPRAVPKRALLALLPFVVVGALLVWWYFAGYESTDDAQIDGHVNSISARVTGHVIKLNVDDNQYVEAGTVLAEIDPKDYQVAVDRARAELADAQATAAAAGVNVPITSVSTGSQLTSADAELLNARAGVLAAVQQADAARAQLDQAEANDVKAQHDLERYKQLVDKQEISQQLFDQAIASAKAGAAGVSAARAASLAADQQVTQAKGRVAQAEAGLRSANTAPQQVEAIRARAASAVAAAQRRQAELEQAQLSLQYTRIVAPVSGMVSGRTLEVGQNVQPGQELMKLIPLDDVWVTANFKETQLKKMRPGQPVTISVDAFGRDYKGHVDSIAGASGARFSVLPPENATGNYVKVVQRIPVKIVLEPGSNKNRLLRPGMSVVPSVKVR